LRERSLVVATEAPPGIDENQARVLAARHGDQATYVKAIHNRVYHPHQRVWAQGLEELDFTLIVCPPDTYKSTTVRDWCERQITKNPNIRILWLMNSGEQAQKQVMTVQQTIESNNRFREAFPHIREDKKAQWTKSVLYVERTRVGPDPTLMATGFNGPYQGLHFDIIIIDDPTGQEDVRSVTTMSLQEEKLRGVILDRLADDEAEDRIPPRIVGILTRWGGNDLVPVFASMGFTVIEMPVVADYPWGPTISPVLFPMEKVERKRMQKGEALFSLTFMCDTGLAAGTVIKREHIEYWEPSMVLNEPMHVYMGIDPAATTHTWSDHSAIATVGLLRKRKIKLLLDIWAARLETPDLEMEVVKRFKRTAHLRAIGIETLGFQVSFMQGLKKRHNIRFQEIPYRSRRGVMHKAVGLERDKVGRAMYLDGELSSGRLLLCRNAPLVNGVSLESELCSISPTNKSKMDDRMDSICFASILADAAVGTSRMFVRMG
jgi:hypothetical protein